MGMDLSLGMSLGLGSSGPAAPSTCSAAQSLASGVAKAVLGTGTTERWYKFTVTQTGTLTIAVTNSTGA
jgi:hypothetical protein